MAAQRAHDDLPDPRPPAEGYAALLAAQKKRADAATAKDVKAQLAAIAEIRAIRLGEAVQAEARAADARLTKAGDDEVARAKDLIAAKKKPEARKVLDKLVADYGAGHAVGKAAQA